MTDLPSKRNTHYILHCSKYEKEREVLFKTKKITKKAANGCKQNLWYEPFSVVHDLF